MPTTTFPTPTYITSEGDWPSFSADGSTVVYVVSRTLRTVPSLGGDSSYLVGDAKLQATRPDWSWNPTTIAFAGQQGDVSTLWLIDRYGENLSQLPNHGDLTHTLYPSWNKDLRTLVAMDSGGDQQIVLYKFTVDGSEAPAQLTWFSDVCAGRPSVNPAGTAVAFAGIKGAFNQQNNQIWTVTQVPPPAPATQVNPLQGRSPNWSPDGKWILFESDREGANYRLFVMPADGTGEPVALTDGSDFVQHGEWSRQQDRIVFSASKKGIGVIDVPARFRSES